MWKGVGKAKHSSGPAKGQHTEEVCRRQSPADWGRTTGEPDGNRLLPPDLPISQSPEPKSKQELVEVKSL